MARYGIVPRSEPINAVIFQGTPSQLINLPAFIKGALAILAIGIGFGYASTQWPVPWFIPVLAVLLVLGGIGLAPKFLWGGDCRQGSRGVLRLLDPDGCLVRFGSQPTSEKTDAVSVCTNEDGAL